MYYSCFFNIYIYRALISLHLGIYDIRVHSVTCTYDMYVYKKRKEIYLIETVKQSKRLGTFRDLPFRKETNRNDRKVSERETTERHVKKTKYRKRKKNERRIRKENNVRNQTKTEKHQTETNKKKWWTEKDKRPQKMVLQHPMSYMQLT